MNTVRSSVYTGPVGTIPNGTASRTKTGSLGKRFNWEPFQNFSCKCKTSVCWRKQIQNIKRMLLECGHTSSVVDEMNDPALS